MGLRGDGLLPRPSPGTHHTRPTPERLTVFRPRRVPHLLRGRKNSFIVKAEYVRDVFRED